MNDKIVIIGAGHVGSQCAYALAMRAVCREIVLIDKNKEKAAAQATDAADGAAYYPSAVTIRAGDYSDCADADIIVISIGEPRKPGQTRLDLLDTSMAMLGDVCENLSKVSIKGIVITITNPADVIAYYTREKLSLPRNRCFGTGTALDSARLIRTISERAGMDARSVSAFAMGEHGDSSIVPFSAVTIGGEKFDAVLPESDKAYITERVHMIGMDIINGKGSTEMGIALALSDIAEAVLRDEKRVLAASVLLDGEYGHYGVNAGVPCVIGADGIEKIVELPLTEEEMSGFNASCGVIREYIDRAENIH